MEREQEIKLMMKDIAEHIDDIKVEIAKANERKAKGATFNCAALHRLRQLLLKVEKIGFTFRKTTIAYQKEKKEQE